MMVSAGARLLMTSLGGWVNSPCSNVEDWLLFCFWRDHVVLGVWGEKRLLS